jgi:hypothetical protein
MIGKQDRWQEDLFVAEQWRTSRISVTPRIVLHRTLKRPLTTSIPYSIATLLTQKAVTVGLLKKAIHNVLDGPRHAFLRNECGLLSW